jgi:CDGSH-type Zn-finger protein
MSDDKGDPKPLIHPAPNGPLMYITNLAPHKVVGLEGDEGQTYEANEYTALCRCGGSENKPLCDGSHGANHFNERKETDGHLDRRKNYEGARIIIHDNRGICSHSSICVDELPGVFDTDKRPWIDANGAGVEEIIATVEKCPSGALSYTIEGVEHRDYDRPPKVIVVKDGPYYLEGWVEVEGTEPRAEEVSIEHCAVCRCGSSKNKPFCDGTHKDIGFKDPL